VKHGANAPHSRVDFSGGLFAGVNQLRRFDTNLVKLGIQFLLIALNDLNVSKLNFHLLIFVRSFLHGEFKFAQGSFESRKSSVKFVDLSHKNLLLHGRLLQRFPF
jgi:hypothetical protein